VHERISEDLGSGEAAPATRSARSQVLVLLVVAAAVAGLVMRAAVQTSSLGVLDGDEAVWGLMVRHALHGEFSAFLWGQGYGGTQEVLLTTPIFAVFGTSVLGMRIVPMALTAVAAVLVWRIGRRTVGEPAATIAGALIWVWPPYLIWKSDRAHGFYGSGLVLAALVLLLTLRLAERRSRRDAVFLGAVLGLAWWQTPQIIPIALPALAYLAVKRRDAYRDAWLALPVAVICALPWLISNLEHHWWSFHIDSGRTPYVTRLHDFFSATFPMAIALRIPFTSEWLLGAALSAVVYGVLLVVLAFFAWRGRRENVALLVAVAAAYPFLYAISPATWLVDEPRYVLMLLPVLVLLLTQWVKSVRQGAIVLALGAGLSAFVLVQLASSPQYDRRADGLDIPRHLAPLIAELDRRGLDRVFSSYWIAYRLDFETRERIIAAEALMQTLSVRGGRVVPQVPTRPNDNRYPRYDGEVRAAKSPGWVLITGSADDARARPLFEKAGYTRSLVGRFAIYQPPHEP